MKSRTWGGVWALLGAALLATGCGPRGPAGPATQPAAATRPAPATRPALLAEALLRLDQLKPPIGKLKNPPPEELSPRVEKELSEAAALVAKRSFAPAIDRLERAVGFNPDDPRIRRALGMAYVGLPNRGKALANFRKAAAVAPDDVELQWMLGRLYAVQKQTAPALLALRKAVRCSDALPTNAVAAEAMLTLGELLYREGYWTASLECLTTLREWIDKHGRDYARRPVLKQLVLRPELLLRRQGQTLMLLRKPAAAAVKFRKAYDRDRSDLVTSRLLVESLLAAGAVKGAEAAFVDMATEPAQRAQLRVLAEAIASAGKDRELPGRIWQAYREQNPVNVALAVSLARTAQRLGAHDEAASILTAAVKEKPNSSELAGMLSAAYLRRGDPERALRVLADLLAANEAAASAVRENVRRIAASELKDEFEIRFADKVGRETSPIKHVLKYVAGELALARGKKLLAAEQFRDAVKAKSDFHVAYEALMETFLQRKRYDEADRLVRQMKAETADSAFAHYLAGKLALARNQPDRAVASLEAARQRDGRHLPTLLALADAYERAGKATEALAVLEKAVAVQPDDAEAYRRMFRLYLDQGRKRSAARVAQRLARRRPESLQAKLMLAELQLLGDGSAEVQGLLGELRAQWPDNADVLVLSVRADLAAAGGLPTKQAFDRMVARLRQVIRRHDENLRAKRMLASVLALPGNHAEAAAVWQQIYQARRDKPDIAHAYASALVVAEQYDRAAAVLARLFAADAQDLWAVRTLMRVLAKRERTDEAAKYVEKGQKLLDEIMAKTSSEPRRAALRGTKLQLYAWAGQFDQAAAYVNKHADTLRDKKGTMALLVLLLMEAKQHQKALTLLDEWIGGKTDASVDELRQMKVVALGEAKQFDKARTYALSWVKAAPDNLLPRRALVSVLAEAGKYDQALKLVDGWIRRVTKPSPVTRPKTTQPTQPATQPSAKPDKILRWCRETAVRMLLLLQKYKEALRRADRYLLGDAANTELLTLKSTCLSETGRRDEAVRCLEQAHKLTPTDDNANNNLGYTYADAGVNLDKAEKMIRLALVIRPRQVAYRDSLAWVYYKTGRFSRAGVIFSDILAETEDEDVEHPVILDHAGDVFYRLGWKDKAVQLWERAMERAKKEKIGGRETRELLRKVPKKVRAVKSGREPEVAPLGEDAVKGKAK